MSCWYKEVHFHQQSKTSFVHISKGKLLKIEICSDFNFIQVDKFLDLTTHYLGIILNRLMWFTSIISQQILRNLNSFQLQNEPKPIEFWTSILSAITNCQVQWKFSTSVTELQKTIALLQMAFPQFNDKRGWSKIMWQSDKVKLNDQSMKTTHNRDHCVQQMVLWWNYRKLIVYE